MKHIFGMATSSSNLEGAKGAKLELAYLRLVYAVKEHSTRGESAEAFLLVMTPKIANTTEKWNAKYGANGVVTTITANLSVTEKEDLEREKEGNVQGMIAGTMGEDVSGLSNAALGKELGESQLRLGIKQKLPEVEEVTEVAKFPYDIQWNFYGVIRS
jgi:hypothetical protein